MLCFGYSIIMLGVLYLAYINGDIDDWRWIPITILCLGIMIKIVKIKSLDKKKKYWYDKWVSKK
nr:MAG TPA: hypothetical protein [Bacteriophage sp.]